MSDQLNFIRNFSIISHVDHGKSTLADRFLELTKTVPKEKMRPQFLDMMDLEREKGITIKMQPVRLIYRIRNQKSESRNKFQIKNSKSQTDSFEFRASNFEFSDSEYILNLIDTPGHVDFSYEVSRSLAAVEGVILLVDATKGIQAQTLANLELAKRQHLVIIPAVNKIDLYQARVEETTADLAALLDAKKEAVFPISAKYGNGVEKLLRAVIEKVPPPKGGKGDSLRALIFDSKYDSYKGVIAYVRIVDGKIRRGDKIYLLASKILAEAKEVGFFKPNLVAEEELKTGEIGYIATGIKEPGKLRVGDAITNLKFETEPLPGYREPKPMVFLSIYPEDTADYESLKAALGKLRLTDPSFIFDPEFKEALGKGFRGGFLGSLHAEIICERLRREFSLDIIISTPSVAYRVIDKKGQAGLVKSAADWPASIEIKEVQEPWARLTVVTPSDYLGKVMKLIAGLRGSRQQETKYFGTQTYLLCSEVPLIEIISGFYDKLKGVSQGYASLNYEFLGFRPAELVKMDILIAGVKEEIFSKIVLKTRAYQEGRSFLLKLKEILPAQLFTVSLQAAISNNIIARETIRARGKDVTAPLYGGDYTRKRKLLEKQKAGKKELKEKGRLRIPVEVIFELMKG